MNIYISSFAEEEVDELIKNLKACKVAVRDNDCIYFCNDDKTYEVTNTVVKCLFIRILGVEEDG